jgi:hypothetical protein
MYVVPWAEFPNLPSYPHICSVMVGVPHHPLLPSLPTQRSRHGPQAGTVFDRPVHHTPPWKHPGGKLTVSSVNSDTTATRIGRHLWELDLRFAPELAPGGQCFTRRLTFVVRRASHGPGTTFSVFQSVASPWNKPTGGAQPLRFRHPSHGGNLTPSPKP